MKNIHSLMRRWREKLRAELNVINNIPLTKTDIDKEVERVNGLYVSNTYKSEKYVAYLKALEEAETQFFAEVKAEFGDVILRMMHV